MIGLQNEAKVAGLRKAVQGFVDVQSFAQYNLMNRLGPALTEIFAADDSEFGRLFSNYLTKPAGSTNKPPAIPAATSDTSATQPK